MVRLVGGWSRLSLAMLLTFTHARVMADGSPSQRAPTAVPPDVQLVLLGGPWGTEDRPGFSRLVVSRVCSPEHCWSEGRIEWVLSDSGQIVKSSSLPQITYGRWVEGGRVRVLQGAPVFDVFVTASHDPGPSRTLRIRTGAPGQYEAELLTLHKPKRVPQKGEATTGSKRRGSLSREAIRRGIRRHINLVRACYEPALARNPTMETTLVVKFTIGRRGNVIRVSATESRTGVPEVDKCVLAAVRRFKFPPPEGDGVVVVQYPFFVDGTGG